MKLGITIAFILTIISKDSKGQFAYTFSSPTEEALCDTISMKHLGDWRRLSLTPMSRDDANGCCNKRGMNLISDEEGVKGDLVGRYIQELHGSANNAFWTSANDRNTSGKFVWANGLEVGMSSLFTFKDDEAKTNGNCVLMEVIHQDLIHLKTSDCETEHPFVCELQPIRAGEPLSEEDLQSCDDIKYVNLLDLPDLRWGHAAVHFALARACCIRKGWSIADESILDNLHLLEKAYQDPHFQKETGLKFKYYVPHSFWLGYNDVCSETKFQWNCGQKSVYKSGEIWISDAPDNEDGNEHCVELSLRIQTKRLQMNDIDCNFPGVYFVCTTNAKCPLEQQFLCDEKRQSFINDTLEEEKLMCKNLTFQYIGKGDYYKYFLSDQSLSWSGAKFCLNEENYDIASFELNDEIKFLSRCFLDPSTTVTAITSVLPQVWNTATNWLLPPTSDIMWDGDIHRQIKKDHRILFRNHDDVYPLCGKTGVHNGVVGVFSEDCLKTLRFIYKEPIGPLPPWEKKNITFRVVSTTLATTMATTPVISTTETTLSDEDSLEVSVELSEEDLKKEKTNPKITPKYVLECTDEELLTYHKHCPESSLIPDSCSLPKNFSKETLFKIGLQNQYMKAVGVKMAMQDYRPEYHEPKLSFRLFRKAAGIYWNLCPIITPIFFQSAIDLFQDLHKITSQGRSEYLTKYEYSWISNILLTCSLHAKTPNYTTNGCGTPIYGVGTCSNFICTNPLYEFNIYSSDPIVDIAWFIYELVHSACFTYFSESSRMFHKFSNAIMDLWTRDIKLRWKNQIEDSSFWKRLLGPFYETDLINMQRCNTAIIKRSSLNLRLAKQQLPQQVRLHGVDGGIGIN